jgi:hypothetical protein
MIFLFENRSYLGEFEAEFKKALARESGAQGILSEEKTEGRKSSDTVPLNHAKCLAPEKIHQSISFKKTEKNHSGY